MGRSCKDGDDRRGSVEAIPGEEGPGASASTDPLDTLVPDPTTTVTAPPETTVAEPTTVPAPSPLEAILAEAGQKTTLLPVTGAPSTPIPLSVVAFPALTTVRSDRYVGRVPDTEALVPRIDAGEGGNEMACVIFEAPPDPAPPVSVASMCTSVPVIAGYGPVASGAEISFGCGSAGGTVGRGRSWAVTRWFMFRDGRQASPGGSPG